MTFTIVYIISVIVTTFLLAGLMSKMKTMYHKMFKAHYSHYLYTYRKAVHQTKFSDIVLTILILVVFPFNILCSVIIVIMLIGSDPSIKMYMDSEMVEYIQWCRENCEMDFCDDLIGEFNNKE